MAFFVLYGILLSQNFHTLGHFGLATALWFMLHILFPFIIILQMGKLSPNEVAEPDIESKNFLLYPLFIFTSADFTAIKGKQSV